MSSPPSRPEHYGYTYVGLGAQYYVAGRYAVAARLLPVAGNLLHHAVEMMLKGGIVKAGSADGLQIKHDIPKLWEAFKRVFATANLTHLDDAIAKLHGFEHIRYPDDMLRDGATISFNVEPQAPMGAANAGTPHYALVLDEVDALIFIILKAAGLNASAVFSKLELSEDAAKYLAHGNKQELA